MAFRLNERPLKPWPGPGKVLLIVLVSVVGAFGALWGTHGWETQGLIAKWAWLIGGTAFCAACLIWMERRW